MAKKTLKIFFNLSSSFYLMKCVDQITLTTNIQKVLVYIYFIIAISILNYLFNKTLASKCNKDEILKITVLASVCAISIILFKWDRLVPKDYVENTITVTTLEDKDNSSQGYETWILGIEIDGKAIDLQNMNSLQGFYYREGTGELVANAQKEVGTLNLNVQAGSHVNIRLGKHSYSGMVEIKNNNKIEKINLFDEVGSDILYQIEPIVKNSSSIYNSIMLLISFVIICNLNIWILTYIYLKLLKQKTGAMNKINKHHMKSNLRICLSKLLEFFNENKAIILIFIAILLVRFIYLISNQIAYLYPDSWGYMEYDFNKLFALDFSNGRTPIYPIILRIIKIIFGESNYLNYVCYFQMIVSFIATIYFYKTLKLISNKKWLILSITFFFGASNAFLGYDFVILTESLALSGTVFLIYHLFRYLKSNTLNNGVVAIFISLLLTFLRPSFLLFDIILLAFWIIQQFITKRKEIFKLILFSLISCSIIFIYSYLFYNSMGIFTISDPMPRQLLVISIDRGYYLNSEDTEYVNYVESCLKENEDPWYTVNRALPYFGLKRTQEYAKESIKNNFNTYIRDLVDISAVNANYDFVSYNIAKENLNKELVTLRNLCIGLFDVFKPIHGLVLALYFMVITLIGLIKNKKMYWLPCGFCVFIVLIFISSMIATCGEYIRTMIHVYPFIYIGIVYLLEINISGQNNFIDKLPIKDKPVN